MNFKESFLDTLDFKKVENPPICEFMKFWSETNELYKDKTDGESLIKHFGLGEIEYHHINFSFFPPFERIQIEDGGDWEIIRDFDGITKKVIKNTSVMPHYIDFPIKNRADFEKLREEKHNALDKGRYPENFEAYIKEIQNTDTVYGFVTAGMFAFMRDNIDFETLMMMFYDEEDLVAEMAMEQANFVISLWERALQNYVPDFVYLGEDMAYKNAPMISPSMVEKIIAPGWDKVISYLKSKGVKNIILDSDGNIESILPIALECGFNTVLPIERAAGMDAEVLRKKYPDLRMIGGVDKQKIAEGKSAIEEEIKKAVRVYKTGGYIPSFDHSVPPIVSYENYKYYIERLKEELSI
jgi:uroporphyrinogen-III decarboxylase